MFQGQISKAGDEHLKNDLNAAGHRWLGAKRKEESYQEKVGDFFCVVKQAKGKRLKNGGQLSKTNLLSNEARK